MRYLLDTNVISDAMRRPLGIAGQRMRAAGREALITSIIVAGELKFGAAKAASAVYVARVEEALDGLTVLPFEAPADQHYAEIRDRLRRIGRPIGGNDMLIAAHALALDCTLVTANVEEFSRVDGLRFENWR